MLYYLGFIYFSMGASIAWYIGQQGIYADMYSLPKRENISLDAIVFATIATTVLLWLPCLVVYLFTKEKNNEN